MTESPINVVLVDDHAIVRTGFRLLLENSSDIRVIAELDSGEAINQTENRAVLHTRRIAGMQQGNRAAGHMCSNGVVQEREAASTMKACSSRDM